MKIKNLVLDHLIEQNYLSADEKDYTTISIRLNKNEVVISGGKIGLIELADYIVNVALSDVKGSHIHLDDHFFDDSCVELIKVKK